jgi:hypothetical protein
LRLILATENYMSIHTFDDTGEAYDACQCDDNIKTGDTLVIRENEYRGNVRRDEDGFKVYEHGDKPISITVVGLAWAWPIAVTVDAGNLHDIEDDADAYARVIADAGFTVEQIKTAVAKAQEIGAPVRPQFDAYLAANTPPRGWESVEGGVVTEEPEDFVQTLGRDPEARKAFYAWWERNQAHHPSFEAARDVFLVGWNKMGVWLAEEAR